MKEFQKKSLVMLVAMFMLGACSSVEEDTIKSPANEQEFKEYVAGTTQEDYEFSDDATIITQDGSEYIFISYNATTGVARYIDTENGYTYKATSTIYDVTITIKNGKELDSFSVENATFESNYESSVNGLLWGLALLGYPDTSDMEKWSRVYDAKDGEGADGRYSMYEYYLGEDSYVYTSTVSGAYANHQNKWYCMHQHKGSLEEVSYTTIQNSSETEVSSEELDGYTLYKRVRELYINLSTTQVVTKTEPLTETYILVKDSGDTSFIFEVSLVSEGVFSIGNYDNLKALEDRTYTAAPDYYMNRYTK